MKPEDIDKLFKDRLGPSSPTPPADLWNRLQDRIETEMPNAQKEEAKPRGFMWLSYSIAAAIALVLSVGVVFYNVQNGTVPVDRYGLADRNGLKAEQPLVITAPATADKQLAQVAEEPSTTPSADEELVEPVKPAETATAPTQPKTVKKQLIAKAVPSTAAKIGKSDISAKSVVAPQQLAIQVEKPVIPDAPQKGDYFNTGETTPVTFAANTVDMNAQPVEIIIKRAVHVQEVEADEELSGFEKKQKLAKNIFKQVRNLSNGEKVELSELGINADRIALETQIGKQKISKVINL
ncbi:ribonuclease E domain-containing protein [Pontibacter lucknowensis]|uniref:Uncharacterized protein n=1 Tax=Pontibacter lucknowensis TaxID=1077936 RepID=A0A1N6WVU6_9BACT|nr:hypothetical protein [Pontibacter lucknowensis]SIQ94227.1 hypothetical protein SAMN05421545_1787 [Pontibacter lucknowensis]